MRFVKTKPTMISDLRFVKIAMSKSTRANCIVCKPFINLIIIPYLKTKTLRPRKSSSC